MTEIKANYSSNSHKSKEEKLVETTEPDKPKFEKMTTGVVVQKKKGLGKKIAETFTGDDATSVGNYVLFEVLLPNIKTMMSDAVSQGVERMLFGETNRRKSPYSGGRTGGGYTSYNRMHTSPGRAFEPDEPKREMSRRGRATHNFQEIIIPDRGEAEMILSTLSDAIETFKVTTVSDLYDLVGITGSFTDNKYGWFDLRDSGVRRVREGYLLELPPTVLLD